MPESPEKDIVLVVADDALAEETTRALREGLAAAPEALRRVVVLVEGGAPLQATRALQHLAMLDNAMAERVALPTYTLANVEREARKAPFLNIQEMHKAQARNKLRPRR